MYFYLIISNNIFYLKYIKIVQVIFPIYFNQCFLFILIMLLYMNETIKNISKNILILNL